ncbi:hypothetical protein [Escherichia phage BI-EHEC]|nr:hypothetical protein [Escherichia phage BI-EHEC]
MWIRSSTCIFSPLVPTNNDVFDNPKNTVLCGCQCYIQTFCT